jgi:hypothetical protein
MPELQESSFERVAERFYEAVALPELWPDALGEIARAAGGQAAVIVPFPASQPFIPCSEGAAELVATFIQDGWVARNSRAQRGATLVARDPAMVTRFVSDFDLFTAEEVKRDPFYQELLVPHGLPWSLALLWQFSWLLSQADTAVWTTLWRRLWRKGGDDCASHGRQSWLRWADGDSFFPTWRG